MKAPVMYFLLLFLALGSCKDEPEATLLLPSNLAMSIEKDGAIEGRVNITATAKDQNYFSIIFDDGDDSETIEAKDGKASHIYKTSGPYTIVARAHATASEYIEINDTVSIYIEPKSNPDGIPTKGFTTSLSRDAYTLAWNDEFDGTELSTANWNYEIGTGNNGWGNSELQYYRKENTEVKNGYLTITARKQGYAGSSYTSSRLTTQGKKFFKYGRVDIRAALPKGKGMWPALWMLGESISTVGWPKCGEIDIMELVGGNSDGFSDKKVYGTIHWDDGGRKLYGGNKTTTGNNFAEEFHVFSIAWDSKQIKWYLNDVQFHNADITPSQLSEFQENFFFIFNVAVGGDWPGSPDASTVFPQKMHVDYIRVFQK